MIGCDVIDYRRREGRDGLNSTRQVTSCSVAGKTGAVVGLDSMGEGLAVKDSIVRKAT